VLRAVLRTYELPECDDTYRPRVTYKAKVWSEVYSAVVKSSCDVQIVSKIQAVSTDRDILAIWTKAQVKEQVTPLAIT